MCDKRDRAINCVFCRDPHLTLMFSGLLQKDLRRKVKFGGKFFKKIIVTFVTQGLPSSLWLLHKFSNISSSHEEGGATKPTKCFFHTASEVYGSRINTTTSNYRLFCFLVRFVIK